jgi:hypothetical protein
MIPDGGAKRQKDGSYIIEHVDLLETSIVGIPANPRSWVEYAVKAIKSKDNKSRDTVVPLGTPTLTLSDNNYTITGTLDGANVLFNSATPEVEDDADAVIESDPVAVDTAESVVDPDITDTQVTIIQIDTGDNADSDSPTSQDAPSSTPEAEGGLLDETADGDDEALGDTITQSVEPVALDRTLSETLSLLRETTRELIDARQALGAAEAAKKALELERDQALVERDSVLKTTKALLDRVASAPLARRAVVRDAQRDLSRFSGVYSESFLNMLKGNDKND